MRTVLETCQPRQSILQGTFNPEVFTAALGPVIQYYRGGSNAIDAVYTDAKAFESKTKSSNVQKTTAENARDEFLDSL